MVTMTTTTLYPAGAADSHGFCSSGGLWEGGQGMGVLGVAGAAKFVFIFVKSEIRFISRRALRLSK